MEFTISTSAVLDCGGAKIKYLQRWRGKNIYNFTTHTDSMTDNNACKAEVAFLYLKSKNLYAQCWSS